MLVHHHIYHSQIGFAGTILFATPLLRSHLNRIPQLRRWVNDGTLLVVAWDGFSVYQPLAQVAGMVEKLYPVNDQLLAINTVLLMFRAQPHVVIFNGDIDEFFVPTVPLANVESLLDDHPECFQCSLGRKGGDCDITASRPWAAIDMRRYNFRSEVGLESDTSDIQLWKVAPPTLECNPVSTYRMSQRDGILPKPLLRPASGGVESWHVHVGMVASGHNHLAAGEQCAYVMHASNLWNKREAWDTFNTDRSAGRSTLSAASIGQYKRQCVKHKSSQR